MLSTFLLVTLMQAQTATATPSPPAETWVGHQVVLGTRKVAVLGDLDTRTDSYMIAEVTRTGDRVEMRQHACRVEMASVMGVDVMMSDATVARLPRTRVVLQVGGGRAQAAPWTSSWGTEDIDADGSPGASVTVDAPMCDGTIYVANSSTTRLNDNRLDGDGWFGDVAVRVRQRVLGATNGCLLWGKRETDELQSGRFLFRRVAPGTTCASLRGRPWPVRAEPPVR